MQKLDPKLMALGVRPGSYDRQRDAIQLARHLRRDLISIEAVLRSLDPRVKADDHKLRIRLEQLQMAAIELLGLGFASKPQGAGRLRTAVAYAFMNIVSEAVRRRGSTQPPNPSHRPSFPDDYPRSLVRATDLALASLEEAIPELRNQMNRPPRVASPMRRVQARAARPPSPVPVEPVTTRRAAVLKALCEAAAAKIRSGMKPGPYLRFVATAVAEVGFTVPATSELRALHRRIGK